MTASNSRRSSFEFGQDLADIRPIESCAGCARGDVLRFHERRENTRDGVQESGFLRRPLVGLSPWP